MPEKAAYPPDEAETAEARLATMLHEGFLARTVGAWRLELKKAKGQVTPEDLGSPVCAREVDCAS